MRDHESRRLTFQQGWFGISRVRDDILGGIVRLHDAWIADVLGPLVLKFQQCPRTLVQEDFERSNLSANRNTLHAETDILKVFCERTFRTQMEW